MSVSHSVAFWSLYVYQRVILSRSAVYMCISESFCGVLQFICVSVSRSVAFWSLCIHINIIESFFWPAAVFVCISESVCGMCVSVSQSGMCVSVSQSVACVYQWICGRCISVSQCVTFCSLSDTLTLIRSYATICDTWLCACGVTTTFSFSGLQSQVVDVLRGNSSSSSPSLSSSSSTYTCSLTERGRVKSRIISRHELCGLHN